MLKLRPYQEQGRDFLAARRFALLADEMRVGKTPQAILAAHKLNAQRIVVTCPAIAVPQWHREFDRWWPGGTLRKHVISYDRARMIHNAGAWESCDVAILDECHFAKNPQAARTKAVLGKNGLTWHAGATWALSGTPITRHPGELWALLIAFGVTGFGMPLSYTAFTRRYCTFDWAGNITGTRKAYLPELIAMLDSIMLRRTRKQVAPEMDEIVFDFLAVEPVGCADLPEIEVAAAERGATSSVTSNRREVALAKAPALVEQITDCFTRGDYAQTVVFAWHRDAIDEIVKGLWARNIDAGALTGETSQTLRAARQQEFHDGKLKVVVAQIIAAGTAIDLSAASHGYFLELDYLPANNIQAANRLVSLKKDEPVTFDICTWPGSADDRVQQILLRRAREIREIL